MLRVICLGEVMMRLQPPSWQRFAQAVSFDVTYGGAELNVATSLANFGCLASFVTKLPANSMGDACLSSIRKTGVDTTYIARGGDRLGIYFIEKGISVRPSKVIYDRKGSSIATACSADFDWDAAFSGADWFHFTGITAALSDDGAALVKDACEKARELGIRISCDLNFRKNLWPREKANRVMGDLMQYIDLLIANEEDADSVFGIRADESDIDSGRLSQKGYEAVAKALSAAFNIPNIAITLRESLSASDNIWSGLLYSKGECFFSRKYNLHILDRVGGGDSFAAGLIYGYGKGMVPQETLEFAVAASALKHTIEGDVNLVSVDEVLSLIQSGGSGRIQR